jgi:hypothetical protein
MGDEVPFLSREYSLLFLILAFARGMDFLSTWIATPNLVLEANPIARRLGWRWGAPVNVALCAAFALWPLPAIIIATTSVLVAARNFQSAWLMRTAGEDGYRAWVGERLAETPPALFLFCLFAQTLLVAAPGAALIVFSQGQIVPVGIGTGLVAYGAAVLVFSLLSLWRNRRARS